MMTLQAGIGILKVVSDLEVEHKEVVGMMQGVAQSAITGIILVYMIMAFGKGIGLSRKEEAEFVEMARKV